jgi:hypothetical protein
VTPARGSGRVPRWAVFLSYAPADEPSVIKIAGELTRLGATVFLDEACLQSDRICNILEALRYADEVLLVGTPTRKDPLNARSAPAFLDRSFVWLALGGAYARGVPIRTLLHGMGKGAFLDDIAIPHFIKEREIVESLRSYEAGIQSPHLLRRIQAGRLASTRQPLSSCRVCLYHTKGCTHALSGIKEQFEKAGIQWSAWSTMWQVEQFHAVAVLVGDEAFAAWGDQDLVAFLDRFVRRNKPVVLVTLPGTQHPLEVPAALVPASRIQFIQFDKSDELSFLKLVWAIVGYRRYELPRYELEEGTRRLSISMSSFAILHKTRQRLRHSSRGSVRREFVTGLTTNRYTTATAYRRKLKMALSAAGTLSFASVEISASQIGAVVNTARFLIGNVIPTQGEQ